MSKRSNAEHMAEMLAKGDITIELSKGVIGTDSPAIKVDVMHTRLRCRKQFVVNPEMVSAAEPAALLDEIGNVCDDFLTLVVKHEAANANPS